ncbi:hypothetical protein [Mesorhizobium sp. M0768]|uniref:hypothetical protein n=1 Tax=Mesorhizobium sp. M0768 TaxID=2956996 RepID=UPI0033392D91
MTIEQRLAMVERKLEALEASIRRHEVKIQVHVNRATEDEHIRRVAAAGVGSALRDYNSRRG